MGSNVRYSMIISDFQRWLNDTKWRWKCLRQSYCMYDSYNVGCLLKYQFDAEPFYSNFVQKSEKGDAGTSWNINWKQSKILKSLIMMMAFCLYFPKFQDENKSYKNKFCAESWEIWLKTVFFPIVNVKQKRVVKKIQQRSMKRSCRPTHLCAIQY